MKLLTCPHCQIRVDASYCPRCNKEMVYVISPKRRRLHHTKGGVEDDMEPYPLSRDLKTLQRNRRNGIGYADE